MEFTKDINFNTNPTANEDLTITYNGFLSNSQELSIVYGYGENWEYTSESKMQKKENGFIGTINLLNYDTLNFCFKNSNNEWDNNSYCNYITTIAPVFNQIQEFDIDALIDELLWEPITNSESNKEINLVSDSEENLDLGYQLSNIMTEENVNDLETNEYSTLDEILTASKVETSEESVKIIEFSENIPELDFDNDEIVVNNEIVVNEQKVVNENEEPQTNQETALVKVSESYIVSSRKLNKLYLLKKRIKLAFYKAFVKIPKLIFGLDDKD